MPLFLSILFYISCITPQKQQRAEARVILGSAYLKEGDIPGAVGVLREATQYNPRSAEAWEKLGLAYYAQDAPEFAEKAFKKALRIAPDRAETNNNYALVLLDQRKYDEAIHHFVIATEDLSYRNTAMVLSNLGRTQQLNNQLDEALVSLNKAIRRAPNLCIARFNRGLVLKDLAQDIAALEDFKVVIKLCGEAATGAYYQAGLLMYSSDQPAACAYFQTVISESVGSPLAIQATQSHKELCP